MGLIPSFLKGKSYYTKEGPGVSKNGPQKKKFILFFEQFMASWAYLSLLMESIPSNFANVAANGR